MSQARASVVPGRPAAAGTILPRWWRLATWLVLLVPVPAAAQVYGIQYRPPEADYVERQSAHFRIIYQEGLEREAAEAAAILEGALPYARALVGLHRAIRLPVVLNRFNDRSGGYVTPLPLKSEIEGVRLKGHALSPRPASWLASVLPHELTHAVHAQSGRGLGLGWAMRPFAPDISRAVNFAVPSGISEGVAVYLESTMQPGWGRLHHALFEMQFRAAMLSDDPWSLAQMLEEPVYDRPLDRFYIGGAYLFDYMASRERLHFFPRARDFFYRMPLLGYGIPLWYGTGEMPHVLGRRLRRYYQARWQAALDTLGTITAPDVRSSGRGLVHRRPYWLDDRTLIAYVSGYDVRPGLYRIDAITGRREVVSHQRITEDYVYHLDPDRSTLYFARYVVNPLVPVQALSDAFRLALSSGSVERLTEDARVAAPVPAGDGTLWALQNDGQFSRIVRIDAGGTVTPVSDLGATYVISIVPSPDRTTLVVLANVRGRQGLFRGVVSPEGRVDLAPWVLFDDGSVYDVSWSADGRYLLFAADPGGIANAYAHDVEAGRTLKLTNVAFGVLEPALSPDGSTLAFVHYRHERYDLATVPFEPKQAEAAETLDAGAAAVLWQERLAEPPAEVPMTEARPYRARDYLAPRMLYPTVRTDPAAGAGEGFELGVGVGVGVQGVDPLERWAYGGEVFYQATQGWGEAYVTSGRFLLRPTLRIYRRPSTVLVRPVDAGGHTTETVRAGRAERGISVGVTLPVVFSSNVFRSEAAFALEGEYRQDQLFREGGDVLRPYQGRLSLRPSAVVALGYQQNLRDIIPNSGVILSVKGTYDAVAEDDRPGRWMNPRVNLFLPFFRGRNAGLQLYGSVIAQNRGGLLDLTTFLPRGYEDRYLGRGTFARFGLEYVQPLWYIEDGFILLPVYFQALYGYTFGETLSPLRSFDGEEVLSAAGGGIGVQLRLFHVADLHVRFGTSFLFGERKWVPVYR